MQRKANRGKFVFFCTVVPLNLIVFSPVFPSELRYRRHDFKGRKHRPDAMS